MSFGAGLAPNRERPSHLAAPAYENVNVSYPRLDTHTEHKDYVWPSNI